MKLSDIMKSNGWQPYKLEKDYNKLKVYHKNNLFFGVQKIGNVFRLDIQQCLDLGGLMLPGDKVLDKQIVPRANLEEALNQILPQLEQQPVM